MKNQAIVLGVVLGFSAIANGGEVDSYTIGDDDSKRVSAAICGAQNHAAASVAKGGSIFNTSTTATNDITCPVILDRFAFTDRYVYLDVYRGAGAGTMSCYLAAYDGSTGTTQTKTVATTGSDSQLSFYSGVEAINMQVGCTVPKKVGSQQSGLRRYLLTEY